MIKLHHGRERKEIWVNADLIETVEATPDTVLKLTTDRRMLVVRDAGGDRRARARAQAAGAKSPSRSDRPLTIERKYVRTTPTRVTS